MPPPTSPFDNQMLTRRVRQFCKIAAWILFLAVIELSLVPPSFRPATVIPHGFEHLIIYFLMGLAFGLGYARRGILTTFLLNGFVGLIEIAQLFVPGRHARMSDFLIDAFAVSLGIASAHLASAYSTSAHQS